MDTTINNEMFNSLLDRVERLAKPAPTKEYIVLPDNLKRILTACLANTKPYDESHIICYAALASDNLYLKEFRELCKTLGIEG